MQELSCLIGHLFRTVEPPGEAAIAGDLTLTGTSHSGKQGTLAITGGAFSFSGDPNDIAIASLEAAKCRGPCPLKGD